VTSGCDVLGGGHHEVGGAAAGHYRAVSFRGDSRSRHSIVHTYVWGNWGVEVYGRYKVKRSGYPRKNKTNTVVYGKREREREKEKKKVLKWETGVSLPHTTK